MRVVSATRWVHGVNNVPDSEQIKAHLGLVFKRVVLVIMLLSLSIAVINYWQTMVAWVDHPVERVTIVGDFKHLNEQNVQQHLEMYNGEGFLNTDLDALKQHIETLPWVKNATVTRIWPGEFHAEIEEQVAVSYWNDNSLLNLQGVVFTPNDLSSAGALPMLRSKTAKEQQERQAMLGLFTYMQKELNVFNLGVDQLEQGVRGDWAIVLSNGIRVVLGKLEENNNEFRSLDNKLERVGKLLVSDSITDKTKIKSLDTRYPNGIAIEWKEQSL